MTTKRIEDMSRAEFIQRYQLIKDTGVPTPEEIAQAEKALGLSHGAIRRRVDVFGWPWERAMTTPRQSREQAGRKGASKSTFTLPGTKFSGTRRSA